MKKHHAVKQERRALANLIKISQEGHSLGNAGNTVDKSRYIYISFTVIKRKLVPTVPTSCSNNGRYSSSFCTRTTLL
jgi:hypothetical protein